MTGWTRRVWLMHAHPNFFVAYQGFVVGMLGTGVLSVTANTSAATPPVLRFYYQLLGIGTWGWAFMAAGALLVAGLFRHTFGLARVGLAVSSFLLAIRFLVQVQASLDTLAADGWALFAQQAAGLPILYLALSSVVSRTRNPPIKLEP